MEKISLKEFNYNETILKILISEIDTIFVYWHISEEYNNKFKERYGKDFFDKTKEKLILRNIKRGKEQEIELEDNTNNYYIKFGYANSIYQVEITRVGIENNEDYGYSIISNKIRTPNIKILLSNYKENSIKFKNLKYNIESSETKYYKKSKDNKDILEKLYENQIIPFWNEYKSENGYREK